MCTQYKQSDTVSTLHTVRQSLTLSLSLSTHHHNPPTNCSLTLPTTTRLGFAYKFVYLLFSRIKTVPERLQLRTRQYRSRRRRGEGRKDETTNARTTVHDADGASKVCLGGRVANIYSNSSLHSHFSPLHSLPPKEGRFHGDGGGEG